jgi:hypothetical protein
MNYHVLLNEQTAVYLNNVESIVNEGEVIIFRGKDDFVLGFFNIDNIMGFYRVDVPTPDEPKEYKWDFDMINEITEKQQEEALKNARISSNEMMEATREASQQIGKSLTKLDENISGKIHGIDYGYLEYPDKGRLAIKVREEAERKAKGWTDTYAAIEKEALYQYNHRDISFHEIHESLNEVGREALERGGLVIKGGTVPLLIRNMLKELLKNETCNLEINHLEKLLKRNMDHCLGVGK